MKTGAELITSERKRQIEEEGWTASHDDLHRAGDLASAAICYIMHPNTRYHNELWPFSLSWWKPNKRKRNLVKAGALIAAEIDKLLRSERMVEGARPDDL